MHIDMSEENFCARGPTKMRSSKTAPVTLHEPAHSKCTWTFNKSHFMREGRRKSRAPKSVIQRSRRYSYRKNPLVWTHCLGKNNKKQNKETKQKKTENMPKKTSIKKYKNEKQNNHQKKSKNNKKTKQHQKQKTTKSAQNIQVVPGQAGGGSYTL